MDRYDAIIVGGGIAGSCAAAALAQKGLMVLVCEAGLPSDKRLAGELMQPTALTDLQALGLLQPLRDAGAVPSYGFALFQGPEDEGTVLSYSEVVGGRPTGIAIEHALMTHTLLKASSRLPRVTVREGARVIAVDVAAPEPVVRIRTCEGDSSVRASLIVAADGRGSWLRPQVGIGTEDGPWFRMVGWRVPAARLPYPGYGHVFLGGRTPTLAYQVSRTDVRIMFELGAEEGIDIPADRLAALPRPLRDDVQAAMTRQPRQVAKVFAMRPERFTAGRVAVVGDSGGCVHPLTASGIAFCTRDARALAMAVENRFATGQGIPEALAQYEAQRREPMRTRVTLGSALAEALCSTAPDMRLLRHGLFRYWAHSRRGRSASMALLSVQNVGMRSMAGEYLAVLAHALGSLPQSTVKPGEVAPALAGLLRRSTRLAVESLRTRAERPD